MDYEAVIKAKLAFIKKSFPRKKRETFLRAKGIYQQCFFEQNKHWLVPYAAFCHLRDNIGTDRLRPMACCYRKYQAKEIAALAATGHVPPRMTKTSRCIISRNTISTAPVQGRDGIRA